MIKKGSLIVVLAAYIALFPLHAGERTIPVDIFVMIDKSLSMAEPGKYESLHKWVRDQLVGQMLINDDWITIYQFYGKTSNLLTINVKTPEDRAKIISTIDSIRPDGKYTDIGLALDTIKIALDKRGPNDRHKIMLLLTDLKQEAPWTSRYAGTLDKFENPYLAEARMLQHDAWYEITLDMDIQDRVVKTSHELFASIQETRGKDAETDIAGSSSVTGDAGDAIGTKDGADESGTAMAGENGQKGTGGKNGAGLPLSLAFMVVSGIVLAGAAAFTVIRVRRNKKEEQKQ